jgi:hypothetical protein
MPRKAFSANHTSWDLLNTRIKERAAEFPHLESQRTELETAMERVMALKVEHRTLTGETLRVARELREAVADASKLESRLRSLLKGTIGDTSEQLFEFGVHPRRPRRKKRPEGQEPAGDGEAGG